MTSLMTRRKTDTDKEVIQKIQINPMVDIGIQAEEETLTREENKGTTKITEMITRTIDKETTAKIDQEVDNQVDSQAETEEALCV